MLQGHLESSSASTSASEEDARDLLSSGFTAVAAKVLTGDYISCSYARPRRTLAQLLLRAPELQAQAVGCLDVLCEHRAEYRHARERFESEGVVIGHPSSPAAADARVALAAVVALWGSRIGGAHGMIEEMCILLREAREMMGARRGGDDDAGQQLLEGPSIILNGSGGGGNGAVLLWEAARSLDVSLHEHVWPLFVDADLGYPLFISAWELSRERTTARVALVWGAAAAAESETSDAAANSAALCYEDAVQLERAWAFLLEETLRKEESTAAFEQRWGLNGSGAAAAASRTRSGGSGGSGGGGSRGSASCCSSGSRCECGRGRAGGGDGEENIQTTAGGRGGAAGGGAEAGGRRPADDGGECGGVGGGGNDSLLLPLFHPRRSPHRRVEVVARRRRVHQPPSAAATAATAADGGLYVSSSRGVRQQPVASDEHRRVLLAALAPNGEDSALRHRGC